MKWPQKLAELPFLLQLLLLFLCLFPRAKLLASVPVLFLIYVNLILASFMDLVEFCRGLRRVRNYDIINSARNVANEANAFRSIANGVCTVVACPSLWVKAEFLGVCIYGLESHG